MKCHLKRILGLSLISILVVLFSIEMITSEKKYSDESIHFYYRDSLAIEDLNSIVDSSNIIGLSSGLLINNGFIFCASIDSFTSDDIHQSLTICDKKGHIDRIPVNVINWKNRGYQLEEINPGLSGNISIITARIFKRTCRTLGMSFGSRDVLLLTQNDTTYYSRNGKLFYMTKESNGVLCEKFNHNHPMDYQMIKNGDIAFIRDENIISMSLDNLQSWRVIYRGKDCKKESMYYRESDSTLVFTEYTAGTVRQRHYVLSYSVVNEKIDTVLTFYTKSEYESNGTTPFCRHIHLITEDPYTGDVWIGTGDANAESALYRSIDKGKTFSYVCGGSQIYRTLSLLFTKDFIFCGKDDGGDQYITRINRNSLNYPDEPLNIKQYPLINSALWCNVYDSVNDMWILSSNSEGAIYDNYHRIYGIKISSDGVPVVYSLIAEKTRKSQYEQMAVQGIDVHDNLWVFDGTRVQTRRFKIIER